MSAVGVLDADQVSAATPWPELRGAIEAILRSGDLGAPERAVHDLDLGDGSSGALLIMPSWIAGKIIGVKAVTFFPTNAGTPVPTINAAYLLFDGGDGRVLAVLDGDELTARRTAAISTLAGDHLSRSDAHRLLVVGTGQLAPSFARAYAEVRQLDVIEIWGRNHDSAAAVAARLVAIGLPAQPSADLATSVRRADIVSCLTGASEPLVHGDDLRRGTHLDLVGSFRADMRESDDAAVEAATVFVDTRAGAMVAGDLAQPLAAGVITEAAIVADLGDLVEGRHPGRTSDDEITVFKSAGFALADLAAARLVWDRYAADSA